MNNYNGDPPHGRYRYAYYRCRCDECKRACADYAKAQRAKRVAEGTPKTHGSPSTYVNYGCRCTDCANAWRDQWQAWRLRRISSGPPSDRHGTLSGYTSYGCRCAACKQAFANHRRQRVANGR